MTVLHIQEDDIVGRPLCGVDHKYPLSTIEVQDGPDLERIIARHSANNFAPICERCQRIFLTALQS